ncbi:MAG: aminotransferase class V-fold PLP-dependent enzyme [Nanopusillaceae archaeon]|jgi:cysteine desulfurase/selenocysteine lyase
MIDPYKIREDFPILKRKVNGKNLIYFDNAATTQKPISVINKFLEVYTNYYANIHRGIHTLSQEASEKYEEAHKLVADFINAKDWREIIFTRNTTESINLVAYSYGLNNLKHGDKIVISKMEHHANLVPWQFVSKKIGTKLEYIDFDNNYRLKLDNIEKIIDDKTKIVAITHASNVLGTINPIEEIIKIAHERGAIVLIDAAQSIPHMKIDVKKYDIDFLAFSAHKMMGPDGIGVLYGKEEILEKIEPFLRGGDMIKDVDLYEAYWNDLPWKFESGTPNIAGGIVFGETIKYINEIGIENIEEYNKFLTKYFIEKYNEYNLKDLVLIGPNDYKDRTPTFSFYTKKYNSHQIAKLLDLEGIEVRSGFHCAHPLLKNIKIFNNNLFNLGGTFRASLYIYNTKEEIDYFFEVLKKLLK